MKGGPRSGFSSTSLTHSDSELTCVDIFSESRWDLRFDHSIRISGGGSKVKKLKGRSQDLLPALPDADYHVIYVDGAHDAASVLLDAMLSWRLLKPGGLLLFDDYLWEAHPRPADRPRMAIDLFLGSLAGRFELIHQGYQVIVRKNST